MIDQESKIDNQISQIRRIGVIGSGTMGSGIAQVAATAGCIVKVFDVNSQALEKSKEALEKILSRLVEKGRIDTSEKKRIQENIAYVSNLKDLQDTDLIIEYDHCFQYFFTVDCFNCIIFAKT